MREKKFGKRCLTWVLVLMMTLSLLPVSALAEDGEARFYGKNVTSIHDCDNTSINKAAVQGTPTAEKSGGNYFYFMSGTEGDAIVVATKVLHENDAAITDFTDVRVPLDTTRGVTGWYADKALTTPVTTLSYDAARTVPVPLYPKVEKGFWVTFESKGGTYMAPQFFTKQASEPTAEPTKFGYDFAGWYADESVTRKAEFASICSTTTLYAGWTARTDTKYTVLYWQENADDDEYSYVKSEDRHGVTGGRTDVAVPAADDGFSVEEPIAQQIIAGDGSTIVNVKYKRNEYVVKFYQDILDESDSIIGNKEIEEHQITAKLGANIADKWPGGAWRVSPQRDDGIWQANLKVMPLGGANFYRSENDTDSDENANGTEYLTEKLDGDGFELDHMVYVPIEWGNIGITDEDCYEIEGFTFKEYTKVSEFYDAANARMYDEYRGAKFYYTRNSYNVAYMNKSKNPVKEAPYKYEADINDAAAFVPSRPYGVPENYTFEGWYKDPECTEKFDFTGKIMPAHNVTVYANWVAPICNVEFVAYGETLNTLKNVPYGMDITSQIPQVGLHEGDEFYGWTYDEAGMQPFNEGTKITSSIILYAQIGNKNGYTVTYDANGGTGKAPADSYRYARNRLAMVLSSSGLTAPAGKNFKGWNAAADGSGTMYQPGESISVSDNITLYAQWERTYRPNPPTSVIDIPDEDALGLNTDDHFAYIIGYPDGTVQPNGQITRAEATTIFFRLLTEESRSANLTKTNGYTDVASDAWYNTAVSTMTKAGIVDGYPDGTFRPDAPITRAEMAKIISLFAKLDKSESRFSDIAGHWAEAYIRLAAGNGWIAGYPDGTFGPQRNITRAETATMINRVLDRVPSEESHLLSRGVMQIWPDANQGDWFYLAMQEATNSHDYERNAKWAAADEQWTALRETRDWQALEQ